jgi:hypothetical protein
MSRLAQLQSALQAHIIDGDLRVTDSIDSSAEIPAATRLQIYSDAYRLRLIEALQANYPLLAQLIGDDAFARLTQLYLVLHPSRHYSIRWFGHRLAQFLGEYPDYCDQPGLVEMARWEWKIAIAFDASDAVSLTEQDLASLAPEEWPQLKFSVHPSMQRIALMTNAVAIVRAANGGESLPPVTIAPQTEWLIWRQELSVQYRSLSAIEAAALDAVAAGASFSEMCEAIAQYVAADDVPLQAATFLKQWIAGQYLVSNTRA